MECLMPSEIARLVFGYLKEEHCDEAARVFLESSPHLQECRTVITKGKTFSTRISDMSLIDILEKYCTAVTIVQERLNQNVNIEPLKRSGDLVEQLRYLLEGSRSQRIVVNINVPSQSNNQTSGDSPIVLTSVRKRHHSNADRERHKRAKVIHQQNQAEQVPIQTYETTEATRLESLPGHVVLKKPNTPTDTLENKEESLQDSLTSSRNKEITKTQELKDKKTVKANPYISRESEIVDNKNKQNEEAQMCTMGTSTEELLSFSCAEVQTTPTHEVNESESEWSNEPVQNISALANHLLARTELQEKLAEKINEVIFSDTPKDDSLCEVLSGEANVSLMTELNNAIKTTVEATEADPVFEDFLNEVIGGNIEETDTSPDDEQIQSSENRQQTISTFPESERKDDRTVSALEDQNAAAVMSIINANMCKKELIEEKVKVSSDTVTMSNVESTEVVKDTITSNAEEAPLRVAQETQVVNTVKTCTSFTSECKSIKKCSTKKQKTKTKCEATSTTTTTTTTVVSEAEVLTMPTLVLWTKEERNNMVYTNSMYQTAQPRTKPKYVPIAPKDQHPQNTTALPEAIYLRAVNVPIKTEPIMVPKVESALPLPVIDQSQTLVNEPKKEKKMKNKSFENEVNLQSIQTNKTVVSQKPNNNLVSAQENCTDVPESLTLYANENSAGTTIETTHMPIINLEDSLNLTSCGLSSFLKFNDKKTIESKVATADTVSINECDKGIEATGKNCDVITKRTPKSLMKSRSKNHRLSLSTPRRRNSHVRALDFSTPTKLSNATKKVPSSESRSKSLCRTTLFKSPPFSSTPNSLPSLRTRRSAKICRPCRVPIATRSPAPKLVGGWDKYTGVGMILGSVSELSNSSTSTSPCKNTATMVTFCKSPRKSWDADLREALNINKTNAELPEATKKRNDQTSEKSQKLDTAEPEKKIIEKISSISKNNSLNQSDASTEKRPAKKYAKLKTISCSVKKVLNESIEASTSLVNTVDIETPRKSENLLDIPPTPRLLTPGSSTLSSFMKISEDSTKIHNLITTPEVPPTPCIVLTPKHEEHIGDAVKKQECSTYYHPEQSKIVLDKVIESTVRAEITQFEVIKENLPREEAAKELKISVTAKECDNVRLKSDTHQYEHALSDSGSESSDSDSSSSSNTSSSSCTSCSSSSDESKSLKNYSPIKKPKKTPHKIYEEAGNESSQTSVLENVRNGLDNENNDDEDDVNNEDEQKRKLQTNDNSSPKKLLPLNKSEEEEIVCIKETPAKDENVVNEANISETPSSSKTGIETLTNLSTKISAFIDSEKQHSNVNSLEPKAKVISVENVSLPVDPRLIPAISMLDSRSRMTTLTSNTKDLLSDQLEKKKQRLKTVLKEAANTLSTRGNQSKLTKYFVKNVVSRNKRKKSSTESTSQQDSNNETTANNGHNAESKNSNQRLKSPDHNFVKPQSTKSCIEVIKKQQETEELLIDDEKVIKKSNGKAVKPSRKRKSADESLDDENHSENTTDFGDEKDSNIAEPNKTQHEELDNVKATMKLKVDQVKRDLFSDEESYEKRTTRSKSRQIQDAQKVITPSLTMADKQQQPVIQEPMNQISVQIPKEEFPGVLECLQLVPTNKSDVSDDELCDTSVSHNGLENLIQIVYDETTQVKKRKRRYSNSDLQFTVETSDEYGKPRMLQVTATPYEELYNWKPKRKVLHKMEPIKSIKRVRKSAPKLSNSEMAYKDEPPRPLATSSPAFKNLISKNIKARSTNTTDVQELDLEIKRRDEGEIVKDKAYTRRKRKLSSREDEIVENTNTADAYPLETLNNLDVNNFLVTLHGST